MQELITQLGIEWKTLLFQIINFLILLYVLRRFVYLPLLRVMDARRRRVEESERQAKKIEDGMQSMQDEYQQLIQKGQAEGQKIRQQAFDDAEKIRQQKLTEAQQEVASLIQKARGQIREEKDHAISEVRSEAAALVTLAAEKVLKESLSKEDQGRLVQKSLDEVIAHTPKI